MSAWDWAGVGVTVEIPRRHRTPEQAEAVFWSRIAVREPNECWLWQGATSHRVEARAYGVCTVFGRNERAHRVAYRLNYGQDPGPLVVRHSCDRPRCCNPRHLLLGTQRENTLDSVARGRARRAQGEASPNAKLTEEQVRAIRHEYRPRRVSYPVLARRYGVSPQLVKLIVTGKAWRHVV